VRHAAAPRRFADVDRAVAEREARIAAGGEPIPAEKLRELVETRQALLTRAREADEVDLKGLRDLEAVERKLLEAVGAYNDFLDGHLLWLRTAEPTGPGDLANLPVEARRLLAPATGAGLVAVFADQVRRSPVFWLALLVAVGVVWKRRAVIAAIEAAAPPVGRPGSDRFSLTLRALVLTLAAAAPLSLLVAAVGDQLRSAAQRTDLSHAVGSSLLYVAVFLFALRVLRVICLPRGLAVAHFGWPEAAVTLLRRELDRLTWILVLAVLVVRLAVDLNPVETGGTTARLAFLVYAGGTALLLFRVLHPRRGMLAHGRPDRGGSWLLRAFPLWWSAVILFPVVLAALALAGYVYTADTLSFLYQHSLWLIAGLVVLDALAVRGLLVVERRLAYDAAVEHRRAALAARPAEASDAGGEESAALQFEEPEVDLAALSGDSRELLEVAMAFAGAVGLYVLWSPVLPALEVFEDVTLWSRTVTVDGEVQRLPVTLASLGLALLYAIGAGVLARRLPAALEILLLRHSGMSSGNRYTATTLTRYAIVAVGLWLVLSTLGVRWSQFQWLVAALGVGIGFGLQEIVANFISGLIMLFERPVRVGDIVTVGETDGVVTRIQIRATTIRNWDRKELLVPNKEFITGRLLNWTLSDQVTRIMVVVGVAYGTDVDRALALMRQAAEESERVLDEPAPLLTFEGFGDNALNLILRAYVGSIDHRLGTITALHKAINDKFEEAGIVIAFPQRDFHLDAAAPLRVRIEDGRGPGEG
jgi:potassium efflux system protein